VKRSESMTRKWRENKRNGRREVRIGVNAGCPCAAQSHWIGSETIEHWSFPHVEKGSLPRTLDIRNGYAQDEYAMKREIERCAHVYNCD